MATILQFPTRDTCRRSVPKSHIEELRPALLGLPAVCEADPAKRAVPLSRAQLISKLRSESPDHDEEQLSRMADLLIAFNAKVLAHAEPV